MFNYDARRVKATVGYTRTMRQDVYRHYRRRMPRVVLYFQDTKDALPEISTGSRRRDEPVMKNYQIIYFMRLARVFVFSAIIALMLPLQCRFSSIDGVISPLRSIEISKNITEDIKRR